MYTRISTRLKGYNYKKRGAYFITLCVNQQLCLFGDIRDKKLQLSAAGKMVQRTWIEIQKFYKNTFIDTYIVMPNHFHGIIIKLNKNSLCKHHSVFNQITQIVTQYYPKPITEHTKIFLENKEIDQNFIKGRARGPAPTSDDLSLGEILARFKSLTTIRYMYGVNGYQWKPFYEKLWQRGYYDHIIKNEKELFAIRQYIINNPLYGQP